MGINEQQGRVELRGIFWGIALAAVFVVVNGFAAFNFLPSSYQQFSWEAYAGVIYTATATPSSTPTATATATATPTTTSTPIANGGTCAIGSQCSSGNCVEGICCNSICNEPGQTCATGTCVTPAAAPTVSNRTLVLIVGLLVAIGFFALTPLRFGKRR
jgi:hypothetical protein